MKSISLHRRALLGLSVGIAAGSVVAPRAYADDQGSSKYGNRIRELMGISPKGLVARPLLMGRETVNLVETGDVGYYIHDPQSDVFLEYSDTARSPYLDVPRDVPIYYSGVGQFFAGEGRGYRHAVPEVSTSAASPQPVVAQELLLRCRREVKPQSRQLRAADRFVRQYEYVQNCGVPENNTGICGYAAAAILLRHWHARDGKYIYPTKYLVGNNLADGSKFSVHLRDSYGSANGTWGPLIRDTLQRYFKANKMSKPRAGYYLLSYGVHEEIGANRPIILFGWLPANPKMAAAVPGLSPGGGGTISHAVLAYGVSGAGDNIVHYGWPNRSKVYLASAVVGSSTWMTP